MPCSVERRCRYKTRQYVFVIYMSSVNNFVITSVNLCMSYWTLLCIGKPLYHATRVTYASLHACEKDARIFYCSVLVIDVLDVRTKQGSSIWLDWSFYRYMTMCNSTFVIIFCHEWWRYWYHWFIQYMSVSKQFRIIPLDLVMKFRNTICIGLVHLFMWGASLFRKIQWCVEIIEGIITITKWSN